MRHNRPARAQDPRQQQGIVWGALAAGVGVTGCAWRQDRRGIPESIQSLRCDLERIVASGQLSRDSGEGGACVIVAEQEKP